MTSREQKIQAAEQCVVRMPTAPSWPAPYVGCVVTAARTTWIGAVAAAVWSCDLRAVVGPGWPRAAELPRRGRVPQAAQRRWPAAGGV